MAVTSQCVHVCVCVKNVNKSAAALQATLNDSWSSSLNISMFVDPRNARSAAGKPAVAHDTQQQHYCRTKTTMQTSRQSLYLAVNHLW